MKLSSLIIGLIIAGLSVYFIFNSSTSQTQVAETSTAQPKTEDVQELEFTGEQLEGYYAVYENPFVIAIRDSLNSYLEGRLADGQGLAEIAITSDTADDGSVMGLDSFSKDYYRSKFIVFARNESTYGGEVIDIVFVDKPDKLFRVWMYQRPDGFEMRGFRQSKEHDEAKMTTLNKQYGKFLKDKEHSL